MARQPRFLILAACLVLLLTLSAFGAAGAQAQCPLGQGYWKNTPQWPLAEFMLGGQLYNQAEMLILFNNASEGDASLILARHLMAAKLNIANGADATAISGIVTQADGLLAQFATKLPYAVAPSSAEGQMMVALAGVLDAFNNGQLTPGCAAATPTATATPEATASPTPEATASPTPEQTPEATDDDLPIIIIIEGPVTVISINIITIYNINIEVDPNDPILAIIKIGDIVRVEGSVASAGVTIVVAAITIIIVDTDVVIIDNDVIWRDDGSCANPPPDWAPANGWRRRCQGGGIIIIGDDGMGMGMGMGMGDDDDD